MCPVSAHNDNILSLDRENISNVGAGLAVAGNNYLHIRFLIKTAWLLSVYPCGRQKVRANLIILYTLSKNIRTREGSLQVGGY